MEAPPEAARPTTLILLPIGDDNPTKRFPLVNYALIAANAFVFAGYAFAPEARAERFILEHGLVPAAWTWQTLLGSMFLHGGLMHLAGNMLFLWIAGDNVEDRLGHLGYLAFYLFAGAAAGYVHIDEHPLSRIPCVGASGAISGVMAAYLVLFPRAHIRFWGLFFFVIIVRTFTFSLPAVAAIGLWFAEQMLMGSLAARDPSMTQVAYDAHIGGFLAGLIVAGGLRLFGVVEGGRTR